MKLKKLISLMLAGAMVLSVTACGGSDGASSDNGSRSIMRKRPALRWRRW